MPPLLAAIEAGGTKFVCAVGTGPEDLREIVRIPTTDPQSTLAAVTAHFQHCQQLHGTITSIGVGTFGPAGVTLGTPDYGKITTTPKVGWQDTDVLGHLRQSFDVPMAFDTDVNAAALSEYRWGAGEGSESVLYLTIGTGIGGGFCWKGNLLHGLLHPEMGHIRLPHDFVHDPFPGGMKTPDAAYFAAPAENKAVNFEGASALRVEMTPTELPDGPFTIEAWVKPSNATGTAPFIAKTEQSEFALNLANNVPGFHCFLGGKYVSAIAPTDRVIPTDAWTHVAGTFDGQEIRLYVNGQLAAKVAASGPRATNALPLFIGADPNAKSQPTQYFIGSVDEVRLSTNVRYKDAFTPADRHTTDADTLLLFHCEEMIGPFLPSDSKDNRYAIRAGSPKFVPAKLHQ